MYILWEKNMKKIMITLRVDPLDYKNWKNIAKKLDITVSDLIRNTINEQYPVVQSDEEIVLSMFGQ